MLFDNKGLPIKISSDNLTNIDANLKTNVNIFWGGSMTSKKHDFCDDCFGLQPDSSLKMNNIKPICQIHEVAPIYEHHSISHLSPP